MRPPEDVKVELVRQWLAKADTDLKASEALLAADLPSLYPTCFHAQQAAEKYLKALLTRHQIEFPKTHAIEQLLALLAPALPEVVSALREAAALTPYGVEIRDPADQPEPSIKEARQALELAVPHACLTNEQRRPASCVQRPCPRTSANPNAHPLSGRFSRPSIIARQDQATSTAQAPPWPSRGG